MEWHAAWELELLYVVRVFIAALLGAFVGYDRERNHGTDAGIRTHMAVCIGACTFALISGHIPDADPTRISAQVVVGIGFIGAGVILNEKGKVSGLTTAAGIWVVAAIGMAVGYGMYILASLTAVLMFGTLALQRLGIWKKVKQEK